MTREPDAEPRCPDCDRVIPAVGAICLVCDADAHFEGFTRTAPPITRQVAAATGRRDRVPPARSDRQAS